MAAKVELVDERDTKDLAGSKRVEELLLSIFTPDIFNAGTDARVLFDIGEHKFFLSPKRYAVNSVLSITLFGGVLYIVGMSVNPMKDEFERGDTDVFTLQIPGGRTFLLDDLRKAKIRLYHDGAGLASDWYVGKTELMARVEGENTYRTYKIWPPLDWLDSKVSREATLQLSSETPPV